MPNHLPIGEHLSRPFRRRPIRWMLVAVLATGLLTWCFALRAAAQEHWPAGSIAQLTGDDISVEGARFAVPVPGATTLFVASGSVVTVHSGDARLTLATGGFVDICGPAKLTVLESGGSFTLALSFGRLHVHMTDATPIRIFTPFLIVTPLSISNEARDFTLGLDVNDSMCASAAQGVGRIEQQFGGDGLLVPQTGELFLAGEKLTPVGGPAGSCRCFWAPAVAKSTAPATPPRTEAIVKPVEPAPVPRVIPVAPPVAPPPVTASAAPPPVVNTSVPIVVADAAHPIPAASTPPPNIQPSAPPQLPPPAPVEVFVFPSNANLIPPVAPPTDESQPDPPAIVQPAVKSIVSPLSFKTDYPEPPEDSNPQMAKLLSDAHVSREWVFKGHVEETAAGGSKHSEAAGAGNSETIPRKRSGMWARFRRFFKAGPPPPKKGVVTNSDQ
ncbi:MAG: hypothetical protein WA755_07930 [Candidatus Acidiferrales bacterium]